MTAVIPSSRRISAGIVPAPGATSRLRPWWSAADWLAEDVPAALDAHPELLSGCHVSRDAVRAVAAGMAAYADYRTGRDCRPTNDRLVEIAGCSLSTVQRARRVLKRLGLVVELVAGRSLMTRSERLAAWRRGSSHRQVAAEFALCSWSRRAPRSRAAQARGVDNSLGAGRIVERDTPPRAKGVSYSSRLSRSTPRRRTENEERRSAPRSHPEARETRPGGVHPGTERLAQAVRSRVGWLRGTSWRRLAPTLSRFARAGWEVRDVQLAIRDALAARGWRVPDHLEQPAAYLAKLLREWDPEDRPTAAEAAHRAAERAEDAYRLQLAGAGRPCPHGMPAGDVPSPLRGLLACPLCRADREPAGW